MLIIGIDGADPRIIQRLHREGRLENLSELIEDGSFSTLRSTHIPITPAAWTSMLTGKNPGKHGVFGFTEIEQGKTKLISETGNHETFLDILEQDNTIGMANIPATFPVKESGAFRIAGILAPDLDTPGTVFPDDLQKMLEQEGYELDLTKTYTGENEDELIEGLEDHIDTKTKVFERLREQKDPDVCFLTYMAIDWASHWFWKHMEDDHPDHEPDNEYSETLENLYVKLDRKIGELRQDGEDVVIVSDHGFTSYTRSLNLNPRFIKEGLIRPKRTPGSLFRYLLYRSGITLERAYNLAKTLGLGHVASDAAQDTDGNILQTLADKLFFSFSDLDWDRTKAYSATDFGPIFIEDEQDREKIQQRVTDILTDLTDGGEDVITDIFLRDDIYSGPYTDKAPDIVYHTKDWSYHTTRFYEFGTTSVFGSPKDNKSGHHHPDGVFLAAGPSFTSLDIDLSILDVAPTLLHAHEHTIPEDMDGTVRTDLLATENEPRYEETVEDITI